MRQCQKCNNPAAEEDRFCTTCGTPLPEEVEPEVAAPEAPLPDCPNCGATAQSTKSRFCHLCGSSLVIPELPPAPETAPAETEQKPQRVGSLKADRPRINPRVKPSGLPDFDLKAALRQVKEGRPQGPDQEVTQESETVITEAPSQEKVAGGLETNWFRVGAEGGADMAAREGEALSYADADRMTEGLEGQELTAADRAKLTLKTDPSADDDKKPKD